MSGTSFVGGLVGLVWGGEIESSYATGDVTGKNILKAAHLYLGRPDWRAGRWKRGATISTSFAKGHVIGMHHVGGLVGENIGHTIRATYAHGDVEVIRGGSPTECKSDTDPAVESVGWRDEQQRWRDHRQLCDR